MENLNCVSFHSDQNGRISFFLIFIYLLIEPHQVLVVACEI